MAYEKKPNEIKRISWHLIAKNLVKFVDDEKSYKLTDKVLAANDFTKYPLSKGTLVEVGIIDNTITFLRKQKSEAKPETHGSEEAYEPTPEEEKGVVDSEKPKSIPQAETNHPIVDGSVRELTVFAVAANKRVVKFLEAKDAGWFQIDAAIQAQDYTTIGLIAKNKVLVTFNDKTVTSLAKVASEPAEQPKTATSSNGDVKVEPTVAPAITSPTQAPAQTPKKEWRPYSSNDNDGRQTSIECQAMINSACEIVGQVAASLPQAPTANVINQMIRAVAEENYKLLQELKKKQ